MKVGDILICIKEVSKGAYNNNYMVDERILIVSNLGSLYRIKKIEDGITRTSIVPSTTLIYNFKPYTNERRKAILKSLNDL